jgi:hypothetical protein
MQSIALALTPFIPESGDVARCQPGQIFLNQPVSAVWHQGPGRMIRRGALPAWCCYAHPPAVPGRSSENDEPHAENTLLLNLITKPDRVTTD